MTDHKDEAIWHIAGLNQPVSTNDGSNPEADRMIQTGLVHATLYLAEQQRIANLIAAFSEGGLTSDVSHLGFENWDQVVAEVREGIGR